MNILINHCLCSDSIWGGLYSCQCIVTLDMVPEGKTYYDAHCPDWALLTEVPYDDRENMRFDTLRVNPEVIDWLNANVKDRKTPSYIKGGAKGWAIGTDKYNSATGISFSFFFERQRDGMNFIKRWSVHKKPVSYLQYFKDIRKELDFKTGKLVRIAKVY